MQVSNSWSFSNFAKFEDKSSYVYMKNEITVLLLSSCFLNYSSFWS